jgi:drug/metabolite transporter (DMT)-like permease
LPNNHTPNQKKAYVLALTTVLFWSTVATAFKIGLKHFSPAMLLFWSILSSLLVIVILLIATRKIKLLRNLTRKQLLFTAAMGFLNPFLYYLILFKAYSLLPAQVAQPLNMIWPIVMVLLSVPLLNQKVSSKSLLAMAISFLGVVSISTQGSLANFQNTNLFGVALALGSSIIWSLYWIFNQRTTLEGEIALFLNFFFAAWFMLPYLWFTQQFEPLHPVGLQAALYIGVFETGLSFVLWLKAISIAENKAKVANLIYIFPFISLIFIHFIVGEEIHATTIAGLLLIVTGIFYQQYGGNKSKS